MESSFGFDTTHDDRKQKRFFVLLSRLNIARCCMSLSLIQAHSSFVFKFNDSPLDLSIYARPAGPRS